MEYFEGRHDYHVDEKGRLKLPAEFRKGLGTDFRIARSLDPCLWLMPAAAWATVVEKLSGGSPLDRKLHALQRHFVAASAPGLLDSLGRLTLPSALREEVGIQHEVVVVGAINRVEIWATDRWNDYLASLSGDSIEELINELDL